MNRKILIAIMVTAGVLLLVTLIWLLLAWQQTDNKSQIPSTNIQTNSNSTVTETTTNPTTDTVTPDATVVVPQDDRQAMTSVARSFTERYGSYSSDTHFENIERSRYLMTAAMSAQADRLIQAGQTAGDEFTSVESEVTSVTFTDFADGATGATLEVAVRQQTIVNQADPTYANVTARLTLKKINRSWQVDSFRWL